MNPEEREILESTLELAQENNRALRKMERFARIGFIWGIIKFLVVVIPIVLGIVYLSPYVEQIWESFQQLRGTIGL